MLSELVVVPRLRVAQRGHVDFGHVPPTVPGAVGPNLMSMEFPGSPKKKVVGDTWGYIITQLAVYTTYILIYHILYDDAGVWI